MVAGARFAQLLLAVLFRSTLVAMALFSISPLFVPFPQLLEALVPNWLLFLVVVFSLPHSLLALPLPKRSLGSAFPYVYEVSSDVGLLFLIFAWKRKATSVWIAGDFATCLLLALWAMGWSIVFAWIFLPKLAGRAGDGVWTTRLYSIVRHPLYLGFIMAFACKPVMIWSDLEWALCIAAYSLVGIFIEEHRGGRTPEYKIYAEKVTSRLVPFVF